MLNFNYYYKQSPNYTTAANTRSVWGVNRQIKEIAIHWWGSPANNPSFAGVVGWLVNPASKVSAHYVATGTGRQVAQLVKEADNSWATGKGNPYTISIECDPRCRPEDYDVIAELIANMWRERGKLPLVPHSKYVATACPGNYDLGRLAALAEAKLNPPAPVPAPVPTPPPAPPQAEYVVNSKDTPAITMYTKKNVPLIDIPTGNIIGNLYPEGQKLDQLTRTTVYKGVTYFISAYSAGKNIWRGFRSTDLTAAPPLPPLPPKNDPTGEDVLGNTDRIGALETEVTAIKKLLNIIVEFLTNTFTNFKKG